MNHSCRDKIGAVQRLPAVILGIACLAAAAGCAGRTPSPVTADEQLVRVGQPCPLVSGGDAPSLVFVEVAEARLAQPGGDLAAAIEAPLPIRGTGHLLVSMGEPASVPWGGCLGEPCKPGVSTLTVTPRLADAETKRLALSVQLAPPPGSAERPRSGELETRNQEPALLRFDDGAPQRPLAWIVTPYLLNSRDDLRQLHACKLENARRDAP